jgi:hypothetical protein
VAVVEYGVARLRKIDIWRDFGTEVELLNGLRVGDQVILEPPADLTDGYQGPHPSEAALAGDLSAPLRPGSRSTPI